MAGLDLKSFCLPEGSGRPNLEAPFRRGAHVFATDGHVCVRVPCPDNVPEGDVAVEAIFQGIALDGPFAPLARAVPPRATDPEACVYCDGRGTEHDCPDCHCDCDMCDGKGQVAHTESVLLAGRPFKLELVRKVAALPAVEFSLAPGIAPAAIHFRFAGGDGLLTGLTKQCRDERHHGELLALPQAPEGG